MIIILFGEMGAGKNYYGEKLSRDLKLDFIDGDTLATPAMIERVSKFKSLSKDIIRNYIVHNLVPGICDPSHKIVAQALYLDDHRNMIEYMINQQGHKVEWIWIKPGFFQNLCQLWSRPKGFRWIVYWIMNKPFFEKPTHTYTII